MSMKQTGYIRLIQRRKKTITADAVIPILRTNSFVNYCLRARLIEVNDIYYRYRSYGDFNFNDLVNMIDDLSHKRMTFRNEKREIYKKELEIRKKNDKVKLFGKKYKLCNDICNVITSFL